MIIVLSAANFVIGMGAFVVVGLLEPLAQDVGISAARAGLLMTVYAVAYALASPLLVSATGGLGRRRVLFAALSLFALGMLGSALAPSELALWAARVLSAMGAGLFTPVAAAVVAGLSAPERRARALAAVFFGLTLAQVAGVPVGAFIAFEFGWRLTFALVFVLALPFLALVWMHVPTGLRFQPVSLANLGQVLSRPKPMLAVSFTAVFLAGIYVVYTFLALLLATQMGFDGTLISIALLVFGIGAVVGNMLGGVLSDRIGPERTLLTLTASQVVLMPVFSLLPLTTPVLFGLIFIWSVCGWSFMAPQQSRLITRAPEVAPVMLALNAAAIYVGAAVGSAIGGAVLSVAGLSALGLAGAAVGVLAFGVLRAARVPA